MDKNKLKNELINMLTGDYSDTVFTSCLYDMFGKHSDAIDAYIKPGREFWHYDGEKRKHRKLKITYVRSGVMFFVFEDDPDNVEHAWFIGSFNCDSLYAAQIYPYEIGKLMSNYIPEAEVDIPNMSKSCKWETFDGEITVDVIWDKN